MPEPLILPAQCAHDPTLLPTDGGGDGPPHPVGLSSPSARLPTPAQAIASPPVGAAMLLVLLALTASLLGAGLTRIVCRHAAAEPASAAESIAAPDRDHHDAR